MRTLDCTCLRRVTGALLGFALVLSPASPAAALGDGFALERLQLAPTREGIVGLRSGTVLPHLRTELTLWTGYSNALLSARSPLGSHAVLAGDRVGGALGASIGLFDRAEVGLVLPYLLFQQRRGNLDRILDPTVRLQPLAPAGVGDLQLLPRVRILDAARFGVELSASLALTVPTGGGESYRGDGGVTVQPAVAASKELAPDLRVGAEMGVLIRGAREVMAGMSVGNEIALGVGAAWKFGFDETTPYELQASLTGEFGLGTGPAQHQSELRVLGAWEPVEDWQVFVGGGLGLLRGYGTPDWRIHSGVRFAFDAPLGRTTSGVVEPELVQADPVLEEIEAERSKVEPQPQAQAEEPEEEEVPDALPVELELRVHFAEGSDVVPAAAKATVKRVADALLARPDLSIYVDGHSDAKGVLELNIGLSYRRAVAVRRHLVSYGVEPRRVEARGFGPERPTATNDTPEGRAENRRVEFQVRTDGDGGES